MLDNKNADYHIEDYHVEFAFCVDTKREYIDYKIEQLERDAIYKAVKQAKGWICVKVIATERDTKYTGKSLGVTVYCRAGDTSQVPAMLDMIDRLQHELEQARAALAKCDPHEELLDDDRGSYRCIVCGDVMPLDDDGSRIANHKPDCVWMLAYDNAEQE